MANILGEDTTKLSGSYFAVVAAVGGGMKLAAWLVLAFPSFGCGCDDETL
jgi:hypothetical protein